MRIVSNGDLSTKFTTESNNNQDNSSTSPIANQKLKNNVIAQSRNFD